MNPPTSVRHNEAEHRFEIWIDGLLALLSYRQEGDRLTIEHTFVPEKLRGHGVAASLASAALGEARTRRWTVIPRCSYVAAYIKRQPQFADLLDLPEG
jgi:predicted GNAT family acetyltransferase